MEEFDIKKHSLATVHTKLTEEEKQELLKKFNITIDQLPMIQKKDPAIQHLEPRIGDIIKVIRDTPTNKDSPYFKVIVHC